jgi:uncharacterized phiE125 gp8 family phage protein
MTGRFVIATAPSVEPVTLAEFKTHARISVSTAGQETEYTDWVTAARQHVESLCGPIITQTVDMYLDEWPLGDMRIPKPRVTSVTSVKYYDEDETEATFSSASYQVDTASHYARIALKDGYDWPSVTLRPVNGIIVRFVAGWADAAAVPSTIKNAIKQLMASWEMQREASAIGNSIQALKMPYGFEELLTHYREYGF